MPFWVEQTRGETVDRINRLLKFYKEGRITQKYTFNTLRGMYMARRDRPFSTTYENCSDPDSFIFTFFPTYCNMWFEGGPEECEIQARLMTDRRAGIIFEVAYEY
jgi:hypothetical protein